MSDPTSDEPPASRPEPAPEEADRLARRLIEDVSAYEVDPPPPARATGHQDGHEGHHADDPREPGSADQGG